MEGRTGRMGGTRTTPVEMEPLEARELLAATLSDGLLTITGTRRDDEIIFHPDRPGGQKYVVSINGKKKKFLRSAVETVSLLGKEGDDHIQAKDHRDVITARIMASGGPGNDKLRGYGVRPASSVNLLDGSRPLVYASDFGARGDGVTDDWTAIQHAINTAPPGAVLVLEPKTYLLSTRLIVEKPLSIAGNNALLKAANSLNYQILFASRLSPQKFSWNEPILAGRDTFNVAIPQHQLAPGDDVFLELGQDPNDPNEQHYATIAKVVENTGTQVRLSVAVPYDISAGAYSNHITPIESLIEDVVVQNLHFDQAAGSFAHVNVGLSHVRNVTLENFSGRFTVAALVSDSRNVTVRNVTGELSRPMPFAGRVLSIWQTDNVKLIGARVSTRDDAPPVFLESVARNTTVRGIHIDWHFREPSTSDVFHVAGDSYGTYIDGVFIRNAGPVQLLGTGSQAGDARFGRVRIAGDAISLPVDLIEDLTYKRVRYRSAQTISTTLQLAPGWKDHQVPLFKGIIKQAHVTISDKAGVQGVFLLNNNYGGRNLLNQLTPGVRTELSDFQMLGWNHPANDPTYPLFSMHLYTAPDLPPGVTMKLEVEYYPL